ncbi:hypothetical protein DRQ21_01065 [Candidatus Fermentibacteria bacterium]|nr:MAG: hypothetical protein DRQ21_01065 [Candidatus Fermentibacteria bacterium]
MFLFPVELWSTLVNGFRNEMSISQVMILELFLSVSEGESLTQGIYGVLFPLVLTAQPGLQGPLLTLSGTVLPHIF